VAAISRRGRSLSVWDVKTGAVTRQTLPVVATCLSYHPSGGMLGVGFQDGTVALCVPALGLMKKLGKHESAVEQLAFHGGGQRLASSSEGAVKVWDVERGLDLLELALPERTARVQQLQFVGDELMVNASGLTNHLTRWNGAALPAR
jgi:WD40 repeat protein